MIIESGGVTLWAIDGLRIERVEGGDLSPDPGAAVEWRRLCAANPSLFDGPIAHVESFDADTGLIRWSRRGYRDLAVQRAVDTGTWQLSVTALLVAGERVHLGRRSERVHVYPGLWEFGPSGGIDPPEGEIDRAELAAQAQREIAEEIGLSVRDGGRLIAVFRDDRARSYDVAIRFDLDGVPELGEGDREYDGSRWVAIDELRRFAGAEPLCPTALVLAEFLSEHG